MDALVKRITVQKDKTVVFELFTGSEEHRVVQNVKSGSGGNFNHYLY